MKLAYVAVALLTVAQFAAAESVAPTFDATGVWSSAGGGTVQIFQEADKVTVVFVGPDYAQKYTATYGDAVTLSGTQTRVTRATGCTTKMQQKFTVESNDTISVWAKAKDGNCDLAKGQVVTDQLTRLQ